MPPAAISRSSTYFPKICGNIATSYRSAFGQLWLSAALSAACSNPAPAPTNVNVDAHELPGCPIPEGDTAEASPFRLTLTALGPFEPSAFDVEPDISLHEAGRPLGFNPRTAGVDAVATDDERVRVFIGHSERRAEQRIDVLLWPVARACPLFESSENAYPGPNGGHAQGLAEAAGLALFAGESTPDQRAGSALVLDTQTGVVSPVLREHGALNAYRAFATVTPFGDGLLVAGGMNPFPEAASVVDAAGSGELYLPAQGGFVSELVRLSFRRAHHAAVELPATGETLLVGGVAPDANGGPGQAILQLEAVSAAQGSSISNLGRLYIGRADPTALVLSDGRVFVGGGYAPGPAANEPGDPVGQVEWFSPAAGPEDHAYAELPPRPHRTFAPLPGGGVLTVASCPTKLEALRRDCTCVTAGGVACDANDPDDPDAVDQAWVDAFWIGPDLVPRPVAFTPGNVLTSCPTPKEPVLVPGSDGAPWLVSAQNDGSACFWRFEAWPEDAEADDDDPTARPRFVTSLVALEPGPEPGAALLSLGPDAFVWASRQGNGGLFGARLGQRGPLTRDDVSLLDPAAQPFRPAHLVPDRDPSTPSIDAPAPTTAPIRYRLGGGSLTLTPVTPPVTLFVTDTLYDDVSILIDAEAPGEDTPPTRPFLVFSSKNGESSTCSFAPDAPATPPLHLVAERLGRQVTLTATGIDETVTCEVPAGPLALGVRAGTTVTKLTSLLVKRR